VIIPRLYQQLFRNASLDTGGTGNTVVDRGDSWTPTEDVPPAVKDPVVKDPVVKDPVAKDPAAKTPPAGEEDLDPDNPDVAAEADDKKAVKKDSRIPLARHKEILERERAERAQLETQLKQYQQGAKVEKTNEALTKLEDQVVALEQTHIKALADGKVDEALKLMREIRTLEREINDTKNEFKFAAATAAATERARYDVVLERIEEAFPALNPDDDAFDKAVLAEVVEWKAFNEAQRGMTPSKALQAAVKKVLGTESRKQETATEVAPKVDEKDVAAERKKAAVEKALADKSPPNTSKVGLDSDKMGGSLTAKDVVKLSQDEFKKLPDDVLSRMRGDTI
jgi:hypothetical protein